MFPFDVILFDVGGVLLTNGWDTQERALAIERFHLDPVGFEARHHAAYPAWERGAIPVRDYLDATVFNEPRSFSRDEFFAFMLAQSKLMPDGALGTLKELSASNKYMLGVLNNEARETNEYRFEKFGLRNYLKVALSSCYLGLRKPDKAIYQTALDILGRPPERILFIDDRMENVAGAVNAGMKAIRFVGEAGLRRELASLGVM
ncbi:MAG TPA: HAD-IA family hydrolase [Terracidiphilus sp.]|nr:HAD-IA family hydrolase [Terracidiphilus sp.]